MAKKQTRLVEVENKIGLAENPPQTQLIQIGDKLNPRRALPGFSRGADRYPCTTHLPTRGSLH